MKKINYLITIIISVCFFNIKGQNNVADFENLTLTPESYWNGSDSSGISLANKYISKFVAGNISFSNTWNSNYSYWSDGWIYSNTSDSVTSGSTNISSCIVGNGANNSSNYSIGKNKVYFNIDTSGNSLPIDGIYVTNTTYAHNSMRDGDAFAKKFTNADQDYYKLLITSFNNGTDVDTVEFFLADFTHLDSLQDYIVNDWKYVDLSSLGLVDSIKFSLVSSDIGQFGMNTPAFFALDDIIINGANVGDFEDLSLSTESYWDGSDLSGIHNNSLFYNSFNSGTYSFANIYDTTYGSIYGSWSDGWSYSNMTDSSTSGYTNLFSAKAGSGFNSPNYSLGTTNSTIVFNQPMPLNIMVCNTTYSHNSMRDGDAFAKKFTNADKDSFVLDIYGFFNGIIIDSSHFYLADFTHIDSTLDFIVNDWQSVSLGSNIYDSVQFNLTSSDIGNFGMNTPAYFCIDNINGKTNYGFENLSLDTNSFFDGSDLSGDPDNPDYSANFSSANCSFDNIWNTKYDYWKSGWSYSNMTDSLNSVILNPYSTKAGSGYGGSENYVIGKSGSYLTYNSPVEFTAFISNNTYTANSMRDGDQFAKKFTNADKDYLKLHFHGYLNGTLIDSSMVYLADFTHTDSTLDYIVNVTPGFDWQLIGIPTNNVDSVVFKLESSDVGVFGMNTPDFYCMDNVGSYPLSTNEISENKFSIYPNPASNHIKLKNIDNSSNYTVSIFDLFGKKIIYNLINPEYINISNLPKGQYLLRIKSEKGITNERLLKI